MVTVDSKRYFAALIVFITLMVCALWVAKPANADNAVYFAGVKNPSNTGWCGSSCQLVARQNDDARYPLFITGVSSTASCNNNGIYYSYPNGNGLTAFLYCSWRYNAWQVRAQNHPYSFYARKPCGFTSGYWYSELHSTFSVPSGSGTAGTPWWLGSLVPRFGCTTASLTQPEATAFNAALPAGPRLIGPPLKQKRHKVWRCPERPDGTPVTKPAGVCVPDVEP